MSQPPLGITAPAIRTLLERYLKPWCFTDIAISDIADVETDSNGNIIGVVMTDGTTILGNGSTTSPLTVGFPLVGSLKSGIAAVGAGAFNVSVVLAPTVPYTVIMALPSWNTTVFFSNNTPGGFMLNFGTACPPGGGSVMWLLN